MKRKLLSIMLTICVVFCFTAVDAKAMQIFVSNFNQELTLEVEPTDRVEELKGKIVEAGVRSAGQELIFAGRVLDDESTLQDYSVNNNSYLCFYEDDLSRYAAGDTILFGSYPQAKVEDSDLRSRLQDEVDNNSWVSYGYYEGSSPSEYFKYQDINLYGVKYRAVRFTKLRPSSSGDNFHNPTGSDEVNGYEPGTTYYFKYQPLKWKVLDPDEGFIVCTSIIDNRPYQDLVYTSNEISYADSTQAAYASNWSDSSIRTWLNDDFYNTAFSNTEKSLIEKSYLENNKIDEGTCTGENTRDKIFLLSKSDATNSSYGFDTDASKTYRGTAYAKCLGLTVYQPDETSVWFLRSATSSNLVNICGAYGNTSTAHVLNNFGIIPALKLTPKSYSITYDLAGGTSVSGKINSVKWTDYVISDADKPVRKGYEFLGWKCGDTDVTNATTYASLASGKDTTSITLTAQWKECTEHTYDSNNTCTKCGHVKVVYRGSSTQRPTIITPENGTITLSSNGRTATITPDAGYEIKSVILNSTDKGKVTELTGLKTDDTISATFEKTKETLDSEVKTAVASLATMKARSAKTAKKNVKVNLILSDSDKAELAKLSDLGYTVKYTFYRSTKKSSGYAAMKTCTTGTYYNTIGKVGKMYYYKARVLVYDQDGKLVASTKLSDCKYANRLWTKK